MLVTENLEDEWTEKKQYIKDALHFTRHVTEDEVLQGIWKGKYQLWTATSSAAVTEIVTYPNSKATRVWLAGGDLEELQAMEKEVVAWANSIGCNEVQIAGRGGWERALQGYERICVILTKGI